MAIAKQCDICGGFFGVVQDSEEPNAIAIFCRESDIGRRYPDIKDACPACIKSIQNHIEFLGVKKESCSED